MDIQIIWVSKSNIKQFLFNNTNSVLKKCTQFQTSITLEAPTFNTSYTQSTILLILHIVRVQGL